MMSKKFNMITTLLFLIVACSGEQKYNEKAPLKGVLTNSKNELVKLELMTPKEFKIVDSTHVADDGKLSFNYVPKEPGFYKISISTNNFMTFIYSPAENISFTADANNLAFTYNIEGSKESTRFKKLNDSLTKIYLSNDTITQMLQAAQAANNAQQYMVAQQKQMELSNIHSTFIKRFIDEKPNSLSSYAAVQKLSPETDIDYFVKVEEGLKKEMPNSELYLSFKAGIAEFTKLSPGAYAPEIMLNDPEGNPVKLSSLRGKVVLIDFWASWCKPCRAENPNVVKLYNQYKEKGFDIYGVSFDQTKDAWVRAIAQDGLIWNHVSDLKGWGSSVAPIYKINSIPSTFLIDKDGKIIAKGLRGEALAQKLAELFK